MEIFTIFKLESPYKGYSYDCDAKNIQEFAKSIPYVDRTVLCYIIRNEHGDVTDTGEGLYLKTSTLNKLTTIFDGSDVFEIKKDKIYGLRTNGINLKQMLELENNGLQVEVQPLDRNTLQVEIVN